MTSNGNDAEKAKREKITLRKALLRLKRIKPVAKGGDQPKGK